MTGKKSIGVVFPLIAYQTKKVNPVMKLSHSPFTKLSHSPFTMFLSPAMVTAPYCLFSLVTQMRSDSYSYLLKMTKNAAAKRERIRCHGEKKTLILHYPNPFLLSGSGSTFIQIPSSHSLDLHLIIILFPPPSLVIVHAGAILEWLWKPELWG